MMVKKTANSLSCAGSGLLGMNPFKSASSVHVPEPGTDQQCLFLLFVCIMCAPVCVHVYVCVPMHTFALMYMCIMWKLEESLRYCSSGAVYLVFKQCFTGL